MAAVNNNSTSGVLRLLRDEFHCLLIRVFILTIITNYTELMCTYSTTIYVPLVSDIKVFIPSLLSSVVFISPITVYISVVKGNL